MLGAIGVVFGDIGTSPLYAFKESVAAASAGGPVTRDIILGVLSLILWSLVLVVTAKYVFILLRADNRREGGHERREKQPDPNSPFAKLMALKAQLEDNKK